MSWAAETNIKGPKGDKGDPGIQGPPGASGSGAGDVTGPAGAVADRIATYNGTTGKVLKDGGKLISDLALTTALPVPSSTLPLVESGSGVIGASAKYAREDHVHPAAAGGSAGSVTFTPSGNIAASNVQAAIVELDNEKVAKAGDTMSGALSINSANASLSLQKAAAGQTNQFTGYTGSSARWQIQLGDSVLEGGGNAGSNFGIARYDDTGAPIDVPLTISRANGAADFKTTPTVSGVPIGGTPNAVRYDIAQGLTSAQMSQGRANIAVTKKNYLINGGMQISQDVTSGTTSGSWYVDQFLTTFAHGGTCSIAQVASPTPGGSPYRLRYTVNTADASVAAGDLIHFRQPIEGLRMTDLRFGSAAAKTVTLQFGVKAPAGTYCVALWNTALNRTYVAEYVIAAGEANTDVVKSVVIPGDTAGTWATDNTLGMYVYFVLMAGTTYQQAAGSWLTTGGIATSNQYNLMSTATPPNNVFELFDVSLTEGSAAPPFQLPDYPRELSLCQRYFQRFQQWNFNVYAATGLTMYMDTSIQPMRAGPTAALSNISYSGASSLALNQAFTNHVKFSMLTTAGTSVYAVFDVDLRARL